MCVCPCVTLLFVPLGTNMFQTQEGGGTNISHTLENENVEEMLGPELAIFTSNILGILS